MKFFLLVICFLLLPTMVRASVEEEVLRAVEARQGQRQRVDQEAVQDPVKEQVPGPSQKKEVASYSQPERVITRARWLNGLLEWRQLGDQYFLRIF